MADAGVHCDARSRLTDRSIRLPRDRRIHHRAGEVEGVGRAGVRSIAATANWATDAAVEIGPKRPNQLAGQVSAFIRHHRGCASGKGVAVAGALQRLFKEGLRRNGAGIFCATATRHASDATAVLQHNVLVRLSKLLPANRHHVGHAVDVDRLILVRNSAADVAKFQRDLS